MRRVDPLRVGCAEGWRRYKGNPILGEDFGETYDLSIVHLDDGALRMYLSVRNTRSIGCAQSRDGVSWSPIQTVLRPRSQFTWEEDVNRPMVLRHRGKFFMWYTALRYAPDAEKVVEVEGTIALALSDDGIHFERLPEPVLRPDAAWEKGRVQSPHVLYDEERGVLRMWYSGGGHWEPEKIGYAESVDGVHWEKYERNPILTPERTHYWERSNVEACQVIFYRGMYYMFYLGMEDMYKGTVNVARSQDGVSGWERYPQNPILSGGMPGAWDVEAVYKPWIERAQRGWRLYANCRRAGVEMIGLFLYDNDALFPDWP